MLNYLMKLRSEFINENYNIMNSFKLIKTKLKKDVPYMNFRQSNDYYNKLYGSKMMKAVQNLVYGMTEYSSFTFCRRLCDFPYYFINDLECFIAMYHQNYIWNFYLSDEYVCLNCSFTHFSYNVEQFQKRYPLLTI